LNEPRPLRDALAEVSAELGLGSADAFALLCARWPDVVGIDVAPHCRPGSLRDGVLTVTVDDAPWATRLRYVEGDVIERAGRLVAPGAVRAVRVTVSGPNSGTLGESI
jgi:predicted nucleic acid-binding Zn ribbon protein